MGGGDWLAGARRQWGVEVAHTRLDVSLGEDACRVRTGWGPANFAILRRFALDWLHTLRGKGGPLAPPRSPLPPGRPRPAGGKGGAVARRRLPPPLQLRRGRRHGGRRTGGNVTIPTARTPPHMA